MHQVSKNWVPFSGDPLSWEGPQKADGSQQLNGRNNIVFSLLKSLCKRLHFERFLDLPRGDPTKTSNQPFPKQENTGFKEEDLDVDFHPNN